MLKVHLLMWNDKSVDGIFTQFLLSNFFKDLFTCIDIRKYFNLKIAKQ